MSSDIKDNIQSVCAIFSIFMNVFLIFLILTKSPAKLGTYKYLMLYFAVVCIYYSISEFKVRPFLFSYKSCLILFVRHTSNRTLDTIMLYPAVGVVAVTISVLAVHFTYRLFALERTGRLVYFSSYYLIIWMSLPLFAGASWTLIAIFCFSPSSEANDFIGPHFFENFGFNLSSTVYASAYYKPIDIYGNQRYNYVAICGLSYLVVFSTIIFTIIFVLGRKIYIKISELNSESEFAKSLQKQLFRALVIQTIFPVIFVFMPIAFVSLLPVFEIQLDNLSDLADLQFAIYPAFDPIPIIFIVDNYRNAVLGYFCKIKTVRPTKPNQLDNQVDNA